MKFNSKMISYIKPNNDISFFFENNECWDLGKKTITGNHFNLKGFMENISNVGLSKCLIKENLNEMMKTQIQKNNEGYVEKIVLEILPRVYDKFIDNGRYESHEGFRHIFLLNVDYLNFENEYEYMQLKSLQRKFQNLNP